MKTLAIFGDSRDTTIFEYYKEIQRKSDQINQLHIPCDIFAYAFIPLRNDNKNIDNIVDAFFLGTSATVVVGCDAYIEHLWEYIDLPVTVVTIVDSALRKVPGVDVKKVVVFSIKGLKESNFLIRAFNRRDIAGYVLPQKIRAFMRSARNRYKKDQQLTISQWRKLSKIFKNIISLNIDVVILDCEIIFRAIRCMKLKIPVLYSRELHIEAIAAYINE